MILFGHRGASIELPENTLEAFERALDVGADAIETDVHVTADGHVVIHHDATATRMAADRRAVADASLAELRRLNVGFGFRDREGRGIAAPSFRVPTLGEALERFPDVRFNVDVKPRRGAALLVVECVRKHRAEDRVLLTSFYDEVVADIRREGFRGETGLSQRAALRALLLPARAPALLRPKGDRIQLPTKIGARSLLDAKLVHRLHALGLAVDFWVVNDEATLEEVVRSGADGVMTDDPRLLARTLGRRPRDASV